MSQRGLDIRILGDLSRAPSAVREAAAEVEAASQRMPHKVGRLNIMFAYTGTYELSRALAQAETGHVQHEPQLGCARLRNGTGMAAVEHASGQAGSSPIGQQGAGLVAGLASSAGPARESCAAAVLAGPCACVMIRADGAPRAHAADAGAHALLCSCSRSGARQHQAAACSAAHVDGSHSVAISHVDAKRGVQREKHPSPPRNGLSACLPHAGCGVNAKCSCGLTSRRSASCNAVKAPHKKAAGTRADNVDALLLTHDCPLVDLMVRTSGEARLSDFMVWQCRGAQLAWVLDLWPALAFSTFARCILDWQRKLPELRVIRERMQGVRSR
jgi:Putative undecaprenyl diphosphate synthase